MADFQPPPTYALPILIDEQTKQAQFNPIWLKWFVDLAQVLNEAGGTVIGDVTGPGSSTDNAAARWNGTSGTAVKDSGVIIDDSNNVSGVVNLTTSGNLLFSSTGQRIRGEFSTLTYANRTVVQTSVTNDLTAWEIIPNGTSTLAAVNVANSSDNENCAIGQLTATATNFRFQSNIRGTGTLVPIAFYLNGVEKVRIETDGQFKLTNRFYPSTDAAAAQTNAGIYAGSGAPNNANGNDGDFYFRSNGGVLTTIYQRRAGAWVGVV